MKTPRQHTASGDGRTAVFSVSMKLTPPSKNTCRLWRPDAMPTFHFSVQKSFPYPTYPPRRNGLDWHGLQRCGNHWDIFCFRHADKKRHIDRTVSHHPQHRRPWRVWLSGFCGGVAGISQALTKKGKPVKLGYGRHLWWTLAEGKSIWKEKFINPI